MLHALFENFLVLPEFTDLFLSLYKIKIRFHFVVQHDLFLLASAAFLVRLPAMITACGHTDITYIIGKTVRLVKLSRFKAAGACAMKLQAPPAVLGR